MELTREELRERIEEGEGRSVEFKRGLPRDEKTARTLCAFANTRGGWLLVGVNDDGSLHGCPRPTAVIAQLRSIARDLLSPALSIQVSAVELEGSHVVATRVLLSPDRPHCVDQGKGEREYVVRVGSSNRSADGPTLDSIRAHRKRSGSLNPLESKILEWLRGIDEANSQPGGNGTPERFASVANVGVQRARKAFIRLERDGLLVGHGPRARRIYAVR